jgi:hypothetical protein
MPPKSSIKTSPFRKEIEEMILEGKSSREISKWLKEHDVLISHNTINRYRKTDFNIQAEAVTQYNERLSQKRKEKGVNETVSDLEYCDEIIQLAHKTQLKADKNTSELDIKKLGLQAIKTKQDIFKQGGDADNEFTIKIVGVDNDGEDDNLETKPEAEEEHQPQKQEDTD